MFFSKLTGGFYNKTIHGDNIPADAVEITTAEHAQLLADQSAGATIQPDGNGFPIAVFPPPPNLADRQAAIWEKIKAERSARMSGGSKVGEKWFHTDPASRVQHLGLKDSGRDMLAAGGSLADVIVIKGESVYWKTMDGTYVPMTVQLALDVVEADKELDATLFRAAETHHTQMLASADPDAYDYTTDWPDRYEA